MNVNKYSCRIFPDFFFFNVHEAFQGQLSPEEMFDLIISEGTWAWKAQIKQDENHWIKPVHPITSWTTRQRG